MDKDSYKLLKCCKNCKFSVIGWAGLYCSRLEVAQKLPGPRYVVKLHGYCVKHKPKEIPNEEK